jgi:hypothetical protein
MHGNRNLGCYLFEPSSFEKEWGSGDVVGRKSLKDAGSSRVVVKGVKEAPV